MAQGAQALQGMFFAMGVLLGALFIAGIHFAWKRTGEPAAATRRATLVAAAGTVVWLAVTFLAAESGRLRFAPAPPTMIPLLIGVFAIGIGVAVSGAGRRLAAGIPLAVLVGVQGFRLPLELMMHRAWEEGLMPEQMSYSGLNYDILTGITALVVAILLFSGRAPAGLVRAWNWLGFALLLNIIVIAILSAPLPFRVFMNEPANVWVTQAPYVWLPAVMVTMALMGHIVIFRRLRAQASARVGV